MSNANIRSSNSSKYSDELALEVIMHAVPALNDSQIKAIGITDGPLQIIAGPGSGKTLALTLRALYILLTGRAEPKEIMVTTFTEKAAFELRDRLHHFSNILGYKGRIHEIRIGTIHSLCDDVIRREVNYTRLKKNYEVLDELTQSLFINDRFHSIFPADQVMLGGLYLGRWQYRWTTIKGIIPYFNKLTEELVEPQQLLSSPDPFQVMLGKAYINYEQLLFDANRIDFAHQQKILHELLTTQDGSHKRKANDEIKYIMVDEYQDTNYIQEQILLKLALPKNNICVVGDEDQSLYRFRGATVRNILEFQTHYSDCKVIVLDVNYRSHCKIIDFYNRFMKSMDWSNRINGLSGNGQSYRFNKTIKPNSKQSFENYSAVVSISTPTPSDEAEEFVSLVAHLKDNKIIEDYSQVALLLHSVRSDKSGHYIQALQRNGIPYYNPRAKAFFENEEVKQIIGCYAYLFDFRPPLGDGCDDNNSPKAHMRNLIDLVSYIDSCDGLVRQLIDEKPDFAKYLRERLADIQKIKKGHTLDMRLIDYFYELLAFEPFSTQIANENSARNLATFSHLITIFQNYYHIDLITERNREHIPTRLFFSFLNFLLHYGIDDYEDPNNPIPKGYVQIMTVHQSKGLEFPVVVVGSLGDMIRSQRQIDRDLNQYYHRPQFEPENRIADFDKMRQYYVAFSRAEKLLVLTHGNNEVNRLIQPVWTTLAQWRAIAAPTSAFSKLQLAAKRPFTPKKSYGFTSHINVFEVCPRQYHLYQEYKFSPSRSASMTFGSLVHQTIEDIHKTVLEGELAEITNEQIKNEWFENNYRSLVSAGMRPLSEERRALALDQVLNYLNQNYDNLYRIVEAEIDVSVEKPSYILDGKIDLLIGDDGKLELLDFKSQKRPAASSHLLRNYYSQLCIYAHILKERYGKHPEMMYIYWTAEPDRESALMQFPVDENDIQKAGEHFDAIVNSIQKKDLPLRVSQTTKYAKNVILGPIAIVNAQSHSRQNIGFFQCIKEKSQLSLANPSLTKTPRSDYDLLAS